MWESFFKIFSGSVDFARSSRKNADDIKKLNERVDGLADKVIALTSRMDTLERNYAQERQILILQLQNILLQHGVKPTEVGQLKPPLTPSE